ncbi:MAG: hypothetical protein JSW52_03575 [Candidatus Coatesbacteria bacterium]|nr:MAG: hypothetical protein JSW52_03575 [Candidatus Coatesbacteria bacterium]
MRLPITILFCTAFISASVTAAAVTTPTITVYTEPPELEIWVEGEYLGVGEVDLFGPFDDYVEITVKGEGYEDTAKVIRSPDMDEGNLVVVIVAEKKRGASGRSLGLGFATGLAILGLLWLGG